MGRSYQKGKHNMKNNGKRAFLSLLGIFVGFVVVMTGSVQSTDTDEETRMHRIEVMSRYENLDSTEYEETTEGADITGDVKQQEEELEQISIKQLTSQIKGFTIQWKKTEDNISGYQVAYSTGKNPEAKKAVRKNVGNKKTKYSVKKLKGTQGKFTGQTEYELNLAVAKNEFMQMVLIVLVQMER